MTLSEHHNGFPGYLPQPLLACSWILEATRSVWSGPAPTVLTVRAARLFAEELAWTAARFPGRLGAVFAPGYARTDFEFLEVPFDDRGQRFERKLITLTALLGLGGSAQPSDDAALAAWPNCDAPLLVAVNSGTGVRRAAALGLGMMFPGGEDPARLGQFARRYRELGGTGPIVWTRSVWLGEPPAAAIEEWGRRYQSAAAMGMRQRSGFSAALLAGHHEDVARCLAEEQRIVSADAVNIRVHLPGVVPEQIGEMIGRIGEDVLPRLITRGW